MLAPALAFSAALQGGALAAFEALQPEPLPRLRVSLESSAEAGDDALLVSDEHGARLMVCTPGDERCRVELPKGTRIRIDAVPGARSTFTGWDGCQSGDGDVLRCQIVVDGDIAVTARFGEQPDEVDVAWIETPTPPEGLILPEPPRPAPLPEEIEAEKLEEAPLEVAMVPPLPPDFVPPPLPPPLPPEPPKTKPPAQPPPDMRMVEVPDQNEVKEAPDDATHLSDKNRDVAEETAAKETNLEKEATGEDPPSAPSEDQSEEIGGPEDEVAQLEDSEATTNERIKESEHTGDSETAKGTVKGDEGEDGEEGKGEKKEPGLLAMRGIEGRGSVSDQGGDGKKEGKKGKKGVKTQLDFDDFERIVGKERAEKDREIAARSRSSKKGRYKKKLEAVKSALENFTPDVRTGNQTALKTRAHPFAVFIARMHRRIHELWGFGYLEALDGKSSDHKLNNFDLFTSIEVSLNPDGTVHKTTIAKTSGELEFDVAALDTILSSAPYEQTPEAIRSVDGRVYLRWGFYRNWRQCGTFNVEPYILTEIPGGGEPLPEGMDTGAPATGKSPVTPEPPDGSGADGVHEGHDHGDKTAGGKEGKYAANMWIAGFSSASVDRMLKVSAVPFYGGTEIAAETAKDLRDVYEGLIVESGALKTWELLTATEYATKVGVQVQLPDDALILVVHAKESFAIVLIRTKSGEYRANAVVR